MQSTFSVVGHWSGDFDEPALQLWAEGLRAQLTAPRVSLGLAFVAPRFFKNAGAVMELLRVHAQIPLLAGCSSSGLIAGGQEIEEHAGLVLGLFALPGAELQGCHFTAEQVQEANGPAYWYSETGISNEQTNGWLVFADPFHMDADSWLRGWNEAYSPLPSFGGLASGDYAEQQTQIYLNGDVFESGGIAVSVAGDIQMTGVISQGCTPIGDTWTITKVEQNIIYEIGNRPAYQVLLDTFNQLSPEEQKRARGNLFIGLVMNEYEEEFHRGDFLIRNLVGADPKSGCLAVGALPRPGQTLQFQRRDARAASEDMTVLLDTVRQRLGNTPIYGGCLCTCNGRGHRLFGHPNHDAAMVQSRLGSPAVAGFFCNGEIGPIGDRTYLHGYTASLALFVKKDPGIPS
jgi:small ligand-binding sensory domain FIST